MTREPLTFDDARRRLGLKDFDVFTAERRAQNVEYKDWMLKEYPKANPEEFLVRGTGRTTKMLVKAVVESQFEYVMIIGHSWDYSISLGRQARQYAERLGLDPEKIVLLPSSPSGVCITNFYDHYTGILR